MGRRDSENSTNTKRCNKTCAGVYFTSGKCENDKRRLFRSTIGKLLIFEREINPARKMTLILVNEKLGF